VLHAKIHGIAMVLKELQDSTNIAASNKPPEAMRSPLTPIEGSTARTRSVRMDNASDVSDLQQVSLFDFGESEFDLMHVRVTVHALTGLLSEKDRVKPKNVIRTFKTTKGKKKDEPTSDESLAASSLSSTTGAGSTFIKTDKTPIFAIASFGRNVTSSETSIKTHLPSLPLGIPTSSFGFVYRYMAQWQEPKPVFLQEEGETVDNQSSFTFLRVMMREPLSSSGEMHGANTSASKYVHETLNIEINLSREKEIIPLGIVTLAISGDEEGPQQMNLPAKAIVFKGSKKIVGNSADVKKSRRMFKKKLKRAAFQSDPKRKYYLDENATLRVTVSLTPQEAINDARAKEQARKIIREQLAEMKTKEQYQNENEQLVPPASLPSRTKTPSDSKTEIQHDTTEPTKRGSFLPTNLFCNAVACTSGEEKKQSEGLCSRKKREDYSVDSSTFNQMVEEEYGYSLASSVLSSVSGSESESESEDEDIHINRKILVLKKNVPSKLPNI
jgi:hypothetical protein